MSRKLALSADERRVLTLKRAARVFARRGFAGATVAELAKASGVSAAMIYKLFVSKEGLYRAVIEDKLERMQSGVLELVLPEPPDDRGFFVAVAARVFELARDDPDFFRLLIFNDLEGSGQSRLWHRERSLKVVDFIRRYILRRTREGAFRPGDADVSARGYLAMTWQMAALAHVFRINLEERPDDERVISELAEVFLRGLQRAPVSVEAGDGAR